MTKLGGVRRKLKKAYRKLHTWEAVAMHFGISRGMAYRVAVEGYEPNRLAIRRKLGLEAKVPEWVVKQYGEVKPVRHREKRAADLWELPVEELRRRLLEREEIQHV